MPTESNAYDSQSLKLHVRHFRASGKKRNILQAVFGVGADYFPESIWKIYVINTPMIFRVGVVL